MLGKGVSSEHFQPRTCSGKKKPETGQVEGKLKNVVYIDVDSDQVDDCIIIDYPEFVSQKSHGSSGPSRTPKSVIISIDDDDGDDDDDESDDMDNPGVVAEGVGELDSDACSSQRPSSASGGMKNSTHIGGDDCDISKKDSVSRMQKSMETCSASVKTADRNRYGLFESESSESDSDCSDCEVLERDQWEKVSAKRKRPVFNDQNFHDEHASSSGLHRNNIDVEVENRPEQHGEGPVCSGPSNGKFVKENQPSFTANDDIQVDGNHFNLNKEESFMNFGQKAKQKNLKSPRSEEMHSFHQCSDTEQGKKAGREKFSPCPKNKNCKYCNDVTSGSTFEKESGGEESNFMSQDAPDCQFDNGERHVKDDGLGLHDKDSDLTTSKERNFFNEKENLKETDEFKHGSGLHDKDDELTASNERNLINEKEKHKETDEYKRAMEEEWASRKQQLQIQADEAQRLRKRKKAESERLLDMQRRQKERIEEVRETQKKDEEFTNMKEQVRVEIRKGLDELVMRCQDMTSLLGGLGIHTRGPNEVHAAYKRALFKFHPDRASKTDIREQVEAEEKFKVITRMKEKFSFTK